MAIDNVQSAGGGASFGVSAGGSTAHSAAAAFGSNNAAGNTILVWVFGSASGAGCSMSSPSVTDTAGNTYTQLFWYDSANQTGGAIGLWIATSIASGANTVSFTFTGNAFFAVGASFTQALTVAEYAGMASPMLMSHDHVSIFGAAGNSPSTLTVTDSLGASVSISLGTAGGAGLGSVDTSAGLADFFVGGVNYLVAACQSQSNAIVTPTTTPSGYQGFAQEILLSLADGSYYHYLFDYGVPGPATIRQPQVCVVT